MAVIAFVVVVHVLVVIVAGVIVFSFKLSSLFCLVVRSNQKLIGMKTRNSYLTNIDKIQVFTTQRGIYSNTFIASNLCFRRG